MTTTIRIFLAGAAVAAIAGLAGSFPVTPVSTAVAQTAGHPALRGPHLLLRNPKYSGLTRDGKRAYEVTATSALPDSRDDGSYLLDEPRVSLATTDGASVRIEAVTGLYDPRTMTLTLQSVALTSAAGHMARMSEAVIELRDNSVVSAAPIQIRLQERTIRANRLEVNAAGVITVYDGLVIAPDGLIAFKAYAVL